MVNNNTIRCILGLPDHDTLEFPIIMVDAVGMNLNTLMFVNKPDMDLQGLDMSTMCVYLLDEQYYDAYESHTNDFLIVKNPKYLFSKVVSILSLPSKLQIEFISADAPSITTECRECIIGDDCEIDKGVIIGGTDFSPVIGKDRGTLIQFPQMGGVIIEDKVVIKYNTMIGKGTFGYTVIGRGTMIDYGCQIGHNCVIGKNCIVAAGTIIGGSTTVGDNVTIGIGAKIRNGLYIGKGASIGMGTVVTKDVPEGCTVVGNPARIIKHDHIMSERGLV